uniref:TPX2 C-terminal domain-containing protein n=1 Tax=Peronospora matthiolae TaxID=2874970 RepID=A0AAV1UXB2_9STRA
MRVTATPPKFEGSMKPVTETQPFELPGDRFHDQARERLERARREEERQCLESSGTFRAKLMPVFEPDITHVIPSTRPLTQTESPMLATKSRAVERAVFEAAEKERREREQAFRKQREQREHQLEEEEIKRLRREEMIFRARPVPEVTHSS